MKLAPSYISAIAVVLATLLPEVEAPMVEATLNNVVVIVGAIIVAVRQVMNGRSTVLGGRPNQ